MTYQVDLYSDVGYDGKKHKMKCAIFRSDMADPMRRFPCDCAKPKATHATLEHTATRDQLGARAELMNLFDGRPMGTEDAIFNIGLWARSGVLVKFILMADLYRRVMRVPGILLEAGVWYGQNAVLLENCRAIFESFHKQRKIVLMDTFTGYKESKFAEAGLYSSGIDYVPYLDDLLRCHARANVYGHQPCPHEIVVGDVCETAPLYFERHPSETVALAILDMGPYEPTKAVLEAIKPRLLPGSLVLLDEFTTADMTGEAEAWLEVMGTSGYKMERLALYPSKCVAEML